MSELPIGETGATGQQGVPGKSAFQDWQERNPDGSWEDFLESLKGEPGDPGPRGLDSTEPGPPGANGLSAYQVWQIDNPGGSRAAFYAAIRGATGATGPRGRPGGLSTASATVQQSTSWGVTTEVVDGNLGLTFQVPPGAVPWPRGQLTSGSINNLRLEADQGRYIIPTATAAQAVTGLLVATTGVVEVGWIRGTNVSTSAAYQRFTTPDGVEYHRNVNSDLGSWSAWEIRGGDSGGGGSVELEGIARVDIILCAGQSNMSGRGTPFDAELDPTHPRVFQYGAKVRTLRLASVPLDMHDDNGSAGLSPATVFGRQWAEAAGETTAVLLNPAAHGGTGFDSGDWNWADASGQWSLSAAMFAQMNEAISAAGTKWPGASIGVRAMIWHQGENTSGLSLSAYAAALDGLFARVRTATSDSDLPIVLGELSPDRTGTHPTTSESVIADTPARVARTAVAHAEPNLSRDGDLSHFGREGVTLLGERMFAAMPAALANATGVLQMPPPRVWAWRDGDTVRIEWDAPLCRATSFLVETSSDDGVNWAPLDTGGTQLGRRATVTNAARAAAMTHVRVTTSTPSATARPTVPVAVPPISSEGNESGSGTPVQDSGWVNLALASGAAWVAGTGLAAGWRRIGNVTYLRGEVYGGLFGSANTAFTLPPEACPARRVAFAVHRPGTGTGWAKLVVQTNGQCYFIEMSGTMPTASPGFTIDVAFWLND